MIIDVHTHIFPPEVRDRRREYVERDEAFAAIYADESVPIATADELLESMDGAGVNYAVACGFSWRDASLCKTHSDYLLEASANSGGQLLPFCTMHPASETARKDMERLAARGARGLGEVRPEQQGYGLIDTNEADVLAWGAAAFDLTLLFHATEPVGPNYAGKAGLPIEQLARFCGDFPGVNVIAAHLGSGLPFYALMPEMRDAFDTTYFDTARSGERYRPEALAEVIELVGAGKVLFGSDYPRVPQADALAQLRAAGLDSEAEERVLGKNAALLLRL